MSEDTLLKQSVPRDVNDNHVKDREKDNLENGIQNEHDGLKRVHLVVPEPKRATPKIALSVHDIGAVLRSSGDNNKQKDNTIQTPGTNPYFPHLHIPWAPPFMPGTNGYHFFQFPGIHSYALQFLPENISLRHAQLEYMERFHGRFPIYPHMFYQDSKQSECQSMPLKGESPGPAQYDQHKSEADTENHTPKDLSFKRSPQVFLDSFNTTQTAERKAARKDAEPARYQCSGCDKCYSTFSGLSKHKQFHCARDNRKEFTCKYCEKCYQSLGALKMHIRTHTLPCKCKICGKAFSRPWLLQGHVRTHTGEKPFTCVHCLRAFADRSNLRAHLQTHSDVKKYSCKSCSKTFSRMSLLLKHEESCTRACL